MPALWICLGAAGALFLLLVFLVFPAFRRHPELKRMEGLRIAHRGLHDLTDGCPENSLAAFRLAAEEGFAIENDIHLSKDGEVVVFHDDDLKRMCGVDGKVEEKTLAELKELKLNGTDERIPTLKECLDAVDGRVPLLIEFKAFSSAGSRELCEKANGILSDYEGVYWVQSFYPMCMRWYKKNRPDVCRGQLASGFYHEKFPLPLLGTLVFNCLVRPDFVSYDVLTPRNVFLNLCVGLGAQRVYWTIRSEEVLLKAEDVYGGKTSIFELFRPDAPDRKNPDKG